MDAPETVYIKLLGHSDTAHGHWSKSPPKCSKSVEYMKTEIARPRFFGDGYRAGYEQAMRDIGISSEG